MSVYRNNVSMTVNGAPSTGTITLNAASTGAQSLFSAYGSGTHTVDVFITDTGGAWEVARDCTYNGGNPGTLTRGTLEASSTTARLDLTSAAVVRVAASANTVQSLALDQVTVTGTSGAISAEVNKRYVADMSGWTADRTLTLPATCAVGDRIQVVVTVGSSTRAVLFTAASGDTLNGVAGGTEWSRLFIANETVTFVCTADNSAWRVEVDGRISPEVEVTGNGSTTQTLTRNANTRITTAFATVASDPASCWDNTNKRLAPRRPGKWFIAIAVPVVSVSSGSPALAFLQKTGGAFVGNAPTTFGNGTAVVTSGLSKEVRMAAGETLETWVYFESSGDRTTATGANEIYFNARWMGD
jgi:hypothetical protein